MPAILADTQSVTFFRPGTSPDMANELYTISLIDAQGDCTYNAKQESGEGVAGPDLPRDPRAPGLGRLYNVPYFVAVSQNDQDLHQASFCI